MSVGSGIFTKSQAVQAHLLVGHGEGKEIADLRKDIVTEFSSHAALVVEEYTNPPAASTNAIKLAIATVAAAVTYSGAQLDGALGHSTMPFPRNVTITTAGVTPANAPATATIVGVDVNGATISETLTPATTAATVAGVKAFASVTSITLPAAGGTAATLAFGFGSVLGLRKKLKTRAGASILIKEISAGSVVTNGTVVAASSGLPNGTYAPNSAPNGSTSYAIYYERDAT